MRTRGDLRRATRPERRRSGTLHMTKHTTFEPGEFCWVDFVAHDMDAAVRFYSELFGWKAEIQETHGGPPYAMFMNGDAVVGGIGQMADEMKSMGIPPMWNSYVWTEDCAATEAKARDLGATVTVPTMEVPGHGKLAFFMDKEGASIACWQSTSNDGKPFMKNEHGSLSWNELMNRDAANAREFYSQLFGWNFETMDMEGMEYHLAKVGDTQAGGMMEMHGEQFENVPPHWLVYFHVDDVAKAAKKVGELGGSVMMPPTPIKVGTFSVVADGQGGTFGLIQVDPDATC